MYIGTIKNDYEGSVQYFRIQTHCSETDKRVFEDNLGIIFVISLSKTYVVGTY